MENIIQSRLHTLPCAVSGMQVGYFPVHCTVSGWNCASGLNQKQSCLFVSVYETALHIYCEDSICKLNKKVQVWTTGRFFYCNEKEMKRKGTS